ncbi:uncharacterized protein LOC129948341 [Eupeodes corollae]|uniref:uncharacterized protein LOC129948341 n=1 Tax=Eupeodes corollae TaxID=290404 RepID=UPI002491FEAE|nr:uncharacterized protein LOC129948341 [Eupeodes corollae]
MFLNFDSLKIITNIMDLNKKVQKIAFIGKIAYAAYWAYENYIDLLEEEEEEKQKRRWWVRELNLTRDETGFFAQNFEQMKERDPEHFYKIIRMSYQSFEILGALIEPHLEKTCWRKPIEPKARLFLVLMYLSQGVPKQVLAWMFRIGYSTVASIIYETCDLLWDHLMPFYLTPPSQHDWRRIASDFEVLWNLPNCVAAIDGKHVNIQCPPGAGSEYWNYKGHNSIVLLASCDANYTFTTVDIGAYGSQSDGGIFKDSSFGRKIIAGDINLPPPKLLPNFDYLCPYYMVGDSAFPLKTYLMRPYPGKVLIPEKINFNKRLSRARRVIENAFGILVAKWRILTTTLNMLPNNADKIVKATVVLHNFVKLNDTAYYSPEFVDRYDRNDQIIHGLWRSEIAPLSTSRSLGSNNSSQAAFVMRDKIKEYLFENQI